jgi:hypothetical protein
MSVLHIDRDTDLPLMYTYEADEHEFQSAGYVRIRERMVTFVAHAGEDTPEERDRFLLKVLTSLRIPPGSAQRVVRSADHVSDPGYVPAGTPTWHHTDDPVSDPTLDLAMLMGTSTGHHEERDGTHLGLAGMLVGLVAGLAVGWLLAGANGAVIGAFVGASTFPDLAIAGWQVAHRNSPVNYVGIHETLAMLMVGIGTVGGGILGYLLAPAGFGQACGVFLGMAVAGFVLARVATTFSMVQFRVRRMAWLGPLVVGAFVWLAHLLWSSPTALALGVVVGSMVAGLFSKSPR